jgi:uncharacterized SAM-binding protein YcdF (DUF218 family)
MKGIGLDRRFVVRPGKKGSLWDALNRPGGMKSGQVRTDYSDRDDEEWEEKRSVGSESKPVEPEGAKWGRPNVLRIIFFLVVILYLALSYYHAPILKRFGRFLIVEHTPQKSELVVCLAGSNVDRALAAADVYKQGLAPKVFVTREEIPHGYGLLQQRGVSYPESRDLLVMALKAQGVPESALVISDVPVKSTEEEAAVVTGFMEENHYRSIILVTSPIQSRRAWLTFRRVIENKETQIFVLPTSYSGFNPENWWANRQYVYDVVLEYEKLIYDTLKNLW